MKDMPQRFSFPDEILIKKWDAGLLESFLERGVLGMEEVPVRRHEVSWRERRADVANRLKAGVAFLGKPRQEVLPHPPCLRHFGSAEIRVEPAIEGEAVHPEIEAKARELRQLQQLIEEAQAEAETIKDQIKAHMGEAEELRAGEYKITWKPVTSSKLDSKALKAAAPELVERFTKTTTTRRFCVA